MPSASARRSSGANVSRRAMWCSPSSSTGDWPCSSDAHARCAARSTVGPAELADVGLAFRPHRAQQALVAEAQRAVGGQAGDPLAHELALVRRLGREVVIGLGGKPGLAEVQQRVHVPAREAAELVREHHDLGERALAVLPEAVRLLLELLRDPVHGTALTAAHHQPGELDRRRRGDARGRGERAQFVEWHSRLTIARYRRNTYGMHIDPYLRTQLVQQRIQEQIDAAARERLVRAARPARAWRIAALRLAARGLRVEREIEFKAARAAAADRLSR